MTRKKFIESHGATCMNWTWSWSFVNEKERFVIFGEWQHHAEAHRALILKESWARRKDNGRKSPGFPQSREHLRLVENEGFKLFTFPIYISHDRRDKDGNGPSKIARFDRELTEKQLQKDGQGWYAYDFLPEVLLPEEIQEPSLYLEGASKAVTVNAYERSREARDKCIAKYGAMCAVCDFDFEEHYGPEVKGLIHVHHLIPLSTIREQYELDPIKHLRPVCPNCHAVIHSQHEALSIEEVKDRMRRAQIARHKNSRTRKTAT